MVVIIIKKKKAQKDKQFLNPFDFFWHLKVYRDKKRQ